MKLSPPFQRAVLVATFLAVSLPVLALDLHDARRSGQVGEQNDGYVSALQASPLVSALVKDVNSKRQQEYARIAAAKGQSVAVVAKLAAEQIVKGLEPGAQYQDATGAWRKR